MDRMVSGIVFHPRDTAGFITPHVNTASGIRKQRIRTSIRAIKVKISSMNSKTLISMSQQASDPEGMKKTP